jgi:hypothetical protein
LEEILATSFIAAFLCRCLSVVGFVDDLSQEKNDGESKEKWYKQLCDLFKWSKVAFNE